MAEGNTCFIDPETGEAFNDQWAFLEGIERVSVSHLNQVFSSIGERSQLSHKTNSQTQGGFEIILDNQVWLNRYNLPYEVIRYIRDELNFINSDYMVKRRMGRSTWKTEKYFNLIGEQEEMINLPRGFLPDLIKFCKRESISVSTRMTSGKSILLVTFQSTIKLYPYQEECAGTDPDKRFWSSCGSARFR